MLAAGLLELFDYQPAFGHNRRRMTLNVVYNEKCETGLKRILDESVDCVLTDPPYMYLKNQKLDNPFDEDLVFSEFKRILKPKGFVVMFGRGTSFYRWNTKLANMGFQFKEEIVWDKSYCTSPLMAISRVHETISIFTKGKGVINRCKVPYLEMKKHNIDSIITDIKRLCTTFHNPKSLKSIQDFLEHNDRCDRQIYEKEVHSIVRPNIRVGERACNVMQSIKNGCNEKSIIRTDMEHSDALNGHRFFGDRKTGDRACNVMQSIEYGQNEKTIIKQPRDHYSIIHPTQKPVRLLERLLNLVTQHGDLVVDPFAGSCSTAKACVNTSRNYICFEIDPEYYESGVNSLKTYSSQRVLF